MSLLMKALEKAAKDRDDAKTESAVDARATNAAVPAAATSGTELSLEPMVQAAPEPAIRPGSAPRAAPASRAPAATAEQAAAATVMQAGTRANSGIGAFVRGHPVALFGVIGGLLLIGFGVYVYLQIANPGLFVRQPPPRPATPLAQAPTQPATSGSTPQAPIPSAAVLPQGPASQPAPAFAPPASASGPAAVAPRRDTPPAPAPVADAQRDRIVITRGTAESTVSPMLTDAYAALQGNRFDVAQRLYQQLLKAEPRSIDALLGLAAIAVQEGRTDEATKHYLQILEFEPRNALAQSGLIGLLGRADPLAAESRLKQLIMREPSPFLYFTLGNLYADQSMWAPAQQAYFQAHNLEPANPEYLFNLAVALEHLGQTRLALGFYRQAVQLAASRGHVNFSLPQAQERIGKLASQLD